MKVRLPLRTMHDSSSWFNRTSPYRRALINSGLKQFEIKLLALLWAGISLLGGLACQQTYKLHAQDEGHLEFSKPSNRLSIVVSPAKPMNTMLVAQATMGQSIFHVNKIEPQVVPVVNSSQQEEQRSNAHTQKADTRRSLWQLSIQYSLLNALNLADQLANARSQLQAGHFEQARQSFERILLQDPHQVMALAGMLVVLSQRDETHQREDYLRRLREEIPEYAPDDNLFLLQLAD